MTRVSIKAVTPNKVMLVMASMISPPSDWNTLRSPIDTEVPTTV